MNITEMLTHHDGLLRDIARTFGETPAALLARPLAGDARVAKLEARLKALAEERAEAIHRVDADIAGTKAELTALKAQLADATRQLAPFQKAMAKAEAAPAPRAKALRKPK